VPYQPGELRAVGLDKTTGASVSLRTAGQPAEIRLKADRSTIRDDRNDLSYVTVEILDRNGVIVPNADVPIHFTVSGAGELAATGSPAPDDASSFHIPVRKTYQGRCLAILRPVGGSGTINLKAEAEGLKSASVSVRTR
jgi:beta-galactosidase